LTAPGAIPDTPTMASDPDVPPVDLASLQRHWNCRLTVRGRRTGRPRSVTIWFALDPEQQRVYLTGSSEPPQWYRNLRAEPDVEVQIGATRLRGRARAVDDPGVAAAIRERFVRRYWLARLARALGRGYVDSVAAVVEDLRPA
jgi:deazaflavin-dependent oxidoreductase (nitroreductase family)